ncbi:hypothetical protein CYMTET_37462 [Cymbomonas tetramitiformis]|uniref:Uncharacterized protein n=1 Tax=Cymbomonas tetramitiformis TaxID=36881 RepID=A0AAE0F674_9CHLO|nr:hypothetical protein CYMTET_37462 [Cymbomonas tetramitiformis]
MANHGQLLLSYSRLCSSLSHSWRNCCASLSVSQNQHRQEVHAGRGKSGLYAVDVVQTLLETRPDSRRLQALGCSVMLTLAQGSEPHRHTLNNRGIPFLITQAMEAHTGLHFGGNFDELKTWLSNCVSRRMAVNANVNKYKEKKGNKSSCAIV